MINIRDLALDDSGDLAVVNGDLVKIADAEAMHQAIKIRTRMFLGECYLDESIGVPWIQKILVKDPDPVVVRTLLAAVIASVPDVTSVVGANLNVDSKRVGDIDYKVQSVYDDVQTSGVVSAIPNASFGGTAGSQVLPSASSSPGVSTAASRIFARATFDGSSATAAAVWSLSSPPARVIAYLPVTASSEAIICQIVPGSITATGCTVQANDSFVGYVDLELIR